MNEHYQIKDECHIQKCQRSQENIKVGIIVKSNCVPNKGAVMIKHQDAASGHTAVLTAQWTSNVTGMTQWLEKEASKQASVKMCNSATAQENSTTNISIPET
jgi:hypothetical protein